MRTEHKCCSVRTSDPFSFNCLSCSRCSEMICLQKEKETKQKMQAVLETVKKMWINK